MVSLWQIDIYEREKGGTSYNTACRVGIRQAVTNKLILSSGASMHSCRQMYIERQADRKSKEKGTRQASTEIEN